MDVQETVTPGRTSEFDDAEEQAKVESPIAEDADEVTFSDFAHSMGPNDAALANALRVKIGVKKPELHTRKLKESDLKDKLKELTDPPKPKEEKN